MKDELVDLIIVTHHNFIPIRVTTSLANSIMDEWEKWLVCEDSKHNIRVYTGTNKGDIQFKVVWNSVVGFYVKDPGPTPQERLAATMEKMVKVEGDEWKGEE